MSNYGRETITLVEIDQPFCRREYGDAFQSPTGGCAAALGVTGDHKCYNTKATCQDPNNYNPGVLTLRFGRDQEGLLQYGNVDEGSPSEDSTAVIPLMRSVQTTPARINLAAMDRSMSPLGQREVVTVEMDDAQHSDLRVDKYRLERINGAASAGSPTVGFDPSTRGTFWGKWLARNPYHANYNCRVRHGYVGDALADMMVRRYVIDRIDGPQGGRVRLTAKDEFSRIEARKSVAPTASRGELAANITAASSSATLLPSGIGNLDYPALPGSPTELYVAIGDEVIKCTRSGDTLTFTQRGALGTTATAHSQEDLVQWVLVYNAQSCTDILYDLLTEYSDIDPGLIDLPAWELEAEELTALYTTRIAEPTPVNELIGELAEQAGFTVWPDPVTGMIRFKALRAGNPTPVVDDEGWIVEGSFSSRLEIAKRVSQAWVYYGRVNPLLDLDERRNYRSRILVLDLDAEGPQDYGTPAIREIFSRWIPEFGRDSAEETGNRVLAMFRDPPLDVEFRLHASRDGEINLAQLFYLETAEIQDFTGLVAQTSLVATQVARDENEIEVRASQVAFMIPPTAEADERVIHIENNDFNLNLRSIYDTLFEAPDGGSPSLRVRFIIDEGVLVGSTSASSPALRTGSWPDVDLTLENHGAIQGMGGRGGNGALGGTVGNPGGDALLVEYTLHLDNSDGRIWAGGGGGAGGDPLINPGAGGGGGGAGTNGGAGGIRFGSGTNGAAGTALAGGAGGLGTAGGNHGGAGGGPGLAGAANSIASKSGGAAGKSINGVANVIWTGSPNGDVRGPTA